MGKRYSKDYYDMMKKYQKKLNKISKETTPWDYGHIEKFVVTSLEFMREYYNNGENVHGLDNPKDPKRIAILRELIMLWRRYIYFDANCLEVSNSNLRQLTFHSVDHLQTLWMLILGGFVSV